MPRIRVTSFRVSQFAPDGPSFSTESPIFWEYPKSWANPDNGHPSSPSYNLLITTYMVIAFQEMTGNNNLEITCSTVILRPHPSPFPKTSHCGSSKRWQNHQIPSRTGYRASPVCLRTTFCHHKWRHRPKLLQSPCQSWWSSQHRLLVFSLETLLIGTH